MEDFKKLLLSVLFVVIPAGIFYYIIQYCPVYFSEIHIQVIVATVLFATLLAIILYTWKTWQLKDLTAKQISLNIKPVVILYKKNDLLKLKNMGNGIAQNISIDEIHISAKHLIGNAESESSFKFRCYINSACLAHNSEEELYYEIVYNDEKTVLDDFILASYIKRFINKVNTITGLKITIHYEDIEKNKHLTVMSNKDGLLKVIKI